MGLLKMSQQFDTKNWDGDIVFNTPKIENGFLEVPEGPGLGVELNEKAIKKYLTPGKDRMLVGRKAE